MLGRVVSIPRCATWLGRTDTTGWRCDLQQSLSVNRVFTARLWNRLKFLKHLSGKPEDRYRKGIDLQSEGNSWWKL